MSTGSVLVEWVVSRYTRRTLALLVIVLTITVLLMQVFFVWYFGSIGLSMAATGYDDDERTVVVDQEVHATFAADFSRHAEEGWCLYGTTNATHIRIESVVHASTLTQESGRVEFTCLPETAGQLLAAKDTRLVGAVHSHPNHDRSYLSRSDIMHWGRVSPVIEVMGVYTATDGVAFFTVRSLRTPLETRTVGPDGERVTGEPVRPLARYDAVCEPASKPPNQRQPLDKVCRANPRSPSSAWVTDTAATSESRPTSD